jgi:hypothetical protein
MEIAMKKSILALSAAAVVGGLGFAGSAGAVAYIGAAHSYVDGVVDTVPLGTELRVNEGGVGHALFVPYFTTQAPNATLLTITNTDTKNGKAVKVRFRGAANSDDILDFTLYLSPGDVWAAEVSLDLDRNGTLTAVKTVDKSCTIPAFEAVPGNPNLKTLTAETFRLPGYLSAAALANHTREGYIEILNMADIAPTLLSPTSTATTNANPLYTAIKHVNGVPPCSAAGLAGVRSVPSFGTGLHALSDAHAAGLSAPTGGLFSNWVIMNTTRLISYSGGATAVQAVTTTPPATINTATTFKNARTNIMFAPQPLSSAGSPGLSTDVIAKYTADPLLRRGDLDFLWYDLPDMSTPMLIDPAVGSGWAAPLIQASDLSYSMGRVAVANEYWRSSGAVPIDTDWVYSQPTRRYFAAVNYGRSGYLQANVVWNKIVSDTVTDTQAEPVPAAFLEDWRAQSLATLPGNRYRDLYIPNQEVIPGMGAYACIDGGLYNNDREEASATDEKSPGQPLRYCGEVGVFQFGGTVAGGQVIRPASGGVLNAQVTPQVIDPRLLLGSAGWANVTHSRGLDALPVVGYAAILMQNTSNPSNSGNYAITLPHRGMQTQ